VQFAELIDSYKDCYKDFTGDLQTKKGFTDTFTGFEPIQAHKELQRPIRRPQASVKRVGAI
jgi:hypothetical protein